MNKNTHNIKTLHKAPEQKEITLNKKILYFCIIIVFLLFWFMGLDFNNNIDMLLNNCI